MAAQSTSLSSAAATGTTVLNIEPLLSSTIDSPRKCLQTAALLATQQIRLLLPSGASTQPIRALFDPGSQINLITNDCVQRLGIRYTPSTTNITGIGNVNAMQGIGYADLHLQHRHENDMTVSVRLVVVPKIAARLPAQRLENCFKKEIPIIELADPQFWVPGKVDALLGAGAWVKIAEEGIIRKCHHGMTFLAQKTLFGWTILGHTESHSQNLASFHLASSNDPIDDIIRTIDKNITKFWVNEDIPSRHFRTPDEQAAEDNFLSTHQRAENGRYIVTIPFRRNVPPLGNSRNAALRRLIQLENKLKLNHVLEEQCRAFMLDYLESGHMIPAPPAPTESSQSYYIPYHAIFKKKFRIVFDASCGTPASH